jgi:hypothetical protein
MPCSTTNAFVRWRVALVLRRQYLARLPPMAMRARYELTRSSAADSPSVFPCASVTNSL